MKKHAYFIHYYFLESTLMSDDRRTPHGNTYNDKVAGVTRKFCIECIFESLYSLKVAETMNQSRIFFYSAFTELEQSTDTPQNFLQVKHQTDISNLSLCACFKFRASIIYF